MTLLIDNREHKDMKKLLDKYIIKFMPDNSKKISLDDIEDLDNDVIEETQLEVGDYADPENGFGVERKSGDFIGEIRNGNLFQKLLELSQYPHSYLIIDKPLEQVYDDLWQSCKRNRRISQNKRMRYFHGQKNMIRGAIASCCIRGYPPIFCNDKKEAAEIIVRLYYKAKDDKNRKVIKAIRPKSTHKDRAINVLINYPHVGEKAAAQLLAHYGSIDAVNKGLIKLFKKPDKKLMRKLGLNKRNLEHSVAILVGEVND